MFSVLSSPLPYERSRPEEGDTLGEGKGKVLDTHSSVLRFAESVVQLERNSLVASIIQPLQLPLLDVFGAQLLCEWIFACLGRRYIPPDS